MICTQGPLVVPASTESRRFFVLQPSDMHSGNQTVESVAYFENVASVTPEAFADYLYSRDISDFNPRCVLATTGLTTCTRKQKLESLGPVQRSAL